MRAIVLRELGPAENLRHEQVDDPRPGPGQVPSAAIGARVRATRELEERALAAAACGSLVPALQRFPLAAAAEAHAALEKRATTGKVVPIP